MATKVEKQQEMFSLIESWRAGGENQQVFCKSHGIAVLPTVHFITGIRNTVGCTMIPLSHRALYL